VQASRSLSGARIAAAIHVEVICPARAGKHAFLSLDEHLQFTC